MQASEIQKIVKTLNEAEVRFLIVGGYAVVAHGYGRFTADLDLVADFQPANLIKAFKALHEIGYSPRVPVTAEQFADPNCRMDWIKNKGMQVLNFHHAQSHTASVDVFVQEPFPFEQAYEEALMQQSRDETVFRFVDLDRLIQMKKEAGRDKDLIDLEYLTKYGNE